jgi:hypothetical protein
MRTRKEKVNLTDRRRTSWERVPGAVEPENGTDQVLLRGGGDGAA